MRIEIKGESLKALLRVKERIGGTWSNAFAWVFIRLKWNSVLTREVEHYKKQVGLMNGIMALMRNKMQRMEINQGTQPQIKHIPTLPPPPPSKSSWKAPKPLKAYKPTIRGQLLEELDGVFKNGQVRPSEIAKNRGKKQ